MALRVAWQNMVHVQQTMDILAIEPENDKDYAINCNPGDSTVSSDDKGELYFNLDIMGFTLSFLALSAVGIVILSDKRIRTHPNELIAYICLADAYSYFQILSRYIYCGFSISQYLDIIFSYSFMWPYYYVRMNWFGTETISIESKQYTWEDFQKQLESDHIMEGSVQIRLSSWYFLSIMVSYMSLFFSTSIILDLFFMLKNPFSSTDARIKKMTIMTLIMSLIFASVGLKLTLLKENQYSRMNLWLFIGVSASNILLGIVTMLFVFWRFRKKGMSQTIKSQIQKRYLEFIIVYTLFEGPFIIWAKPSYIYKENFQGYDYSGYVGSTRYIDHFGGFLLTLFGLLIAISRIRDKIIRAKLTNIWYHLTCRRDKMIKFDKFEKLVEQSQMNTFLKTSLNTELVITILKGILILGASSSDKIDHMDDQDMYKIKQTQTIEMDQIKIKNAGDFSIDATGAQSKISESTKPDKEEDKEAHMHILDSETEDEDDEAVLRQAQRHDSLKTKFKSMNFVRRATSFVNNPGLQPKQGKAGDFVLPGAKITAFATSIFQRMRAMDNIGFDHIQKSLHPRTNRDQIFKTGEAAGASGSFFFFSHDRRFIVKTLMGEELTLLLKILPALHKHFKKNPSSLLSRIYGVYTVEMQDYQKVHLILMGNTLRFDNNQDISRIYDMKGSTFSRLVKGRTKHTSTLKDQNFVTNQFHVQEIQLSSEDRDKVNDVIKKDTNFLASMNIMDYSILLGIESKVVINTEMGDFTACETNRSGSVSSTAELERFKRHRFTSPDRRWTYHVSIIDYLQFWNCQKVGEQFLKTKFLGANKLQLSSVEPNYYKTRFQKFMSRQVFIQTNTVSKSYLGMSFSSRNNMRMTSLSRSDSYSSRSPSLNLSQRLDRKSKEKHYDEDDDLFNVQMSSFHASSGRENQGLANWSLRDSLIEEHNFFNGVSPTNSDDNRTTYQQPTQLINTTDQQSEPTIPSYSINQ